MTLVTGDVFVLSIQDEPGGIMVKHHRDPAFRAMATKAIGIACNRELPFMDIVVAGDAILAHARESLGSFSRG